LPIAHWGARIRTSRCCFSKYGKIAYEFPQEAWSHLRFEAANPRHEHEWRLWQDVRLSADKVIMPGLITHSTTVVEHPELGAERLLRFVDCVGRENVMAGSDWGFSQSPLGARVHRSLMWAKLRSLAEGAEIASRQGLKQIAAIQTAGRSYLSPCVGPHRVKG
jgi:methionine synthase II (cobalamin-independent)